MSSSSRQRRWLPWVAWALSTTFGGAFLADSLFGGGSARRLFMPGETSDGHHQIEVDCDACHTAAFGGPAELQAACEHCHSAELAQAKDSHPVSKFTDPRNAARVASLDARFCVTCHREHATETTLKAGLTLPEDYCIKCHADVADARPSHRALPFASCDDAGCHNFHDNRALYEDFLVKRLDEPRLLDNPKRLTRVDAALGPSLTAADVEAARRSGLTPPELDAWANSAHGRARTECGACHGPAPQRFDAVPTERCAQCHASQVETWRAGKHGMRTARELEPIEPREARLPMQGGAGSHLSCNACHPAHGYDRQHAAVRACLGCHADDHSVAYARSRHAALLDDEWRGLVPRGSGVSCATCHLPELATADGGVVTQHNQNDNLRPNEKMIRSVCNRCHGLSFSIDALADAALVRNNFNGPPGVHVGSLEMAARRAKP
jgi:formate-dependent nitrite reductase cytochrome c552 subunit